MSTTIPDKMKDADAIDSGSVSTSEEAYKALYLASLPFDKSPCELGKASVADSVRAVLKELNLINQASDPEHAKAVFTEMRSPSNEAAYGKIIPDFTLHDGKITLNTSAYIRQVEKAPEPICPTTNVLPVLELRDKRYGRS